LIAVATLLVVSMAAMLVLAVSIRSTPAAPAPTTTPQPTGLKVSTGPKFDASAVFAARVAPAMQLMQQKNDQAAARAVDKIHGHFRHARGGAPEFAASIVGPLDAIKTTYLAGKGATQRWWHEDPRYQPVANHVKWNYELNVTSGDRIRDNIMAAVMMLEMEFRANRNEALQSIGSNLRTANLPTAIAVDEKQLDAFCQQQFELAVANVNQNHVAENAAMGSAVSFATSAAVTFIVEQAIARAITSAATTAGGATVGGAGGGAAAGSAVPGAGTVIGATAGLLAGCAVDMWLTSRNERKTIAQIESSLNQLEHAVINGGNNAPGLRGLAQSAAAGQTVQLRAKLMQQIQEAAR
jgi:hypothetical protein